MSSTVAYVVRLTKSVTDPFLIVVDQELYYTGSQGKFSLDIRRAKLYPTDKAARASYSFTQQKRWPSHLGGTLDTHKVSIVY